MVLKCVLLLFILTRIISTSSSVDRSWSEANRLVDTASRLCPYPKFEHGRWRMRQRSKLIKFICVPGYELAGNKYATCRDGKWDVPLPVCVRPGCILPDLQNGQRMVTHGGAWVIFFCYPNYMLVGPKEMYCDGRKWNTNKPQCVEPPDSRVQSRLSCDFEDADLCGWRNDDYHDFDWKRINKKTPSSFLFTGPSYDHTLGQNEDGHYIYIESTSRLENDTARLISPLYSSAVAKSGCFSFYYHMYGKTTGGLRIYQKPEKVSLNELLKLSGSDMQQYLLFEKWGNQGDTWYRGLGTLTEFGEDFQIVIEGIRGTSFTSDIAVDDVAILQGDNCTLAKQTLVTPTFVMPDSCQGRCDVFGVQPNEMGCGCTAACVTDHNCCPDFFEVCVFDSSTTPDDFSSADLPQTQKLVAHTVSMTSTTTSTTTTTTTTTPKPTTTPPKPIITSTKKLATIIPTTPTTTVAATTKTMPTTKRTSKPTTQKVTKLTFKTTEKMLNKTGLIQKSVNTPKPVKVVTKMTRKTTVKPTTTTVKTTKFAYKLNYLEDTARVEKVGERRKETIEHQRRVSFLKPQERPKSSAAKTTILIITGLLCFVGAACLFAWSRSSRGRSTIAKLRGRVTNDPDVRYLHATDDDLE